MSTISTSGKTQALTQTLVPPDSPSSIEEQTPTAADPRTPTIDEQTTTTLKLDESSIESAIQGVGGWRMERHRKDEPGITRAPIISKLNKLFMKKICFCFCSLIHAWVRVSSLSLSYKKDVMSMSNGPIRGPVSYKWGSYRKIWVRIP